MRVREFFTLQSSELGFLWKYQMLLGVLVILAGLLIAFLPEILVALISAAILLVGASFIGSAWRMRRLERQSRGFGFLDPFEW